MKKYTLLFLTALTLAWAAPAQAQIPMEAEQPLAQALAPEDYASQRPAWWNALGRQLTLVIDKPVEDVDPKALQNIIYFATHFGERVQLRDATPQLLEIYRKHERVEFRMLALSALHAIGDAHAMEKLQRLVREEPPGRVRKLTVAALAAHYQKR